LIFQNYSVGGFKSRIGGAAGSTLSRNFTISTTSTPPSGSAPTCKSKTRESMLIKGALFGFADVKVTTAPVVVHADAVPDFDVTKLKGHTAKVYDSLERAVEQVGECPPDGSPGFPEGVVTMSRDEWRDQYYADAKVKEPDIEAGTLRQRFTRAVSELLAAKTIVAVGERVWIA
jgi:hypothetical protein